MHTDHIDAATVNQEHLNTEGGFHVAGLKEKQASSYFRRRSEATYATFACRLPKDLLPLRRSERRRLGTSTRDACPVRDVKSYSRKTPQ